MRLLIVVPEQNRETGNWVTAMRLADGLESCGHRLAVVGVAIDSGAPLQRVRQQFDPDAVLLLHAFRSGRPWLESGLKPVPVLVLLTGTDVNQGLDDPTQEAVINQVFVSAKFILLQNRKLIEVLKCRRPELGHKIEYLPPGVSLGNAPYPVRRQLGLDDDRALLLCPASVRPVKGVVELLELGDQLALCRDDFHLACCGPLLAGDYAHRFLREIEGRCWASYLGVIPHDAMASAIGSANLVLNNSFHEGLPNALVEADALGVPILARDIPGNAEVVRNGENGLLYSSAESFVSGAQQILDQPCWRSDRLASEGDVVNWREVERLDALLRSIAD
ncbi:MAG: hypothetical protein C0614_11230 [Desulfuromonas sp.]|nr:MAG: hypothetical protein C0614_11230 [Desulfuromonas sp.]